MMKCCQILLSNSTCAFIVRARTEHVRLPMSAAAAGYRQELTLVHFSAQRKHFMWGKGCLGGVHGVFMAGVEGVFRRLGDVLSVRNGSG